MLSESQASVPIEYVQTSEVIDRNLRDYQASRVQDAISGYIFINAMFAFVESRLLDDLERDGAIDSAASAARHGYDPRQTLGLLRYLATQDVLKERERFYPTPAGRAALSPAAVGRLRLYRGGYGELVTNAARLLDGSARYGRDLQRDGAYVGTASNAITSSFFNEVPLRVLDELGVTSIADMGCGSAAFLCEYVRGGANRTGIGIDIAEGAIAEARGRVAAAGLAERLRLVVGNCFDLDVLRRHAGDAQVLFAHAMEHEILRDGEDAVLAHIDGLARAFPGRSYLMGEPMLGRAREHGPFYWVHVLSCQGIPLDVSEWTRLLSRLRRARLERVFRPDHGQGVAYFLMRFPPA